MPHCFEIKGGEKLSGKIEAGGSKNASFPILAATILLSEKVTIDNLPKIEDIKCFLQILKKIGADIRYINPNKVLIDPSGINNPHVPYNLGSQIRGSYYLLGSLISKLGEAIIPYPGGCDIGNRPMDLHIKSLKKIGVGFNITDKTIAGILNDTNRKKLEITLPFPSRGATINIILASVLKKKETVKIINANYSPETNCLINFLKRAGSNIKRKNSAIIITGVRNLKINKFSIIPDKIEVATLLSIGLITNGKVTVRNINIDDIDPFLDKLSEIGFKYEVKNTSITTLFSNNLKPIKVMSGLKAPCIDADFEPILAALLCTVKGKSIIEDEINPERHSNFIPQLKTMGAKIRTINDTKAIINGGIRFKSANVISNDIRGGASLILAALAAEGTTIINNIFQIDRGYENIEKKLSNLNAKIKRKKIKEIP